MTNWTAWKPECRIRVMLAWALFCLIAVPASAGEAKARDGGTAGVIVRRQAKVEKQEYDWGWIQWMMNSQVHPGAEMTFGIVEIKAGKRNPLHVHANCEELLYVISGSCEHRVGDRVDVLRKGDMIRIPAGAPHMARTRDEPMRAIIVYSAGQRQFEVLEEAEPE